MGKLKRLVGKILVRRKLLRKEFAQISIETTTKCNLACQMCPHDQLNSNENIDFSLFQTIIKKIAPLLSDQTVVSLVGLGEPFLNPDFLKQIALFKKYYSNPVAINTNGVIMLPKILDVLSSKDRILVSVNCLEKDYYTFTGHHQFQKVKSNLEKLLDEHKRRNSQVIIMIQLMDLFIKDLEEFTNLWKPYLNQYVQIYLRQTNNWAGNIDIGKPKDILRYPCYQLWGVLSFDLKGNIYPCCPAFSNRESSALLLGTIDDDFDTIQTKIIQIRKHHLKGQWYKYLDCANCDSFSFKRNVFFKRGSRWL